MTPDYFITADDANIMAAIAARLLSLSVTDKAGESSDSFDMLLDDSEDLIDPPRTGAKLKIWIGYRPAGSMLFQGASGLAYMGAFIVDEIEVGLTPRHLRITGKSADMRAALKSPKTRHFDSQQTMKKTFGKIADEHKMRLKIDADLGKTSLPDFVQSEESDLHLATRIAARFGAIVKYADGNMIVTRRGSMASASGLAMPAIVLSLNDIKGGRGRLKDRERYGSASAAWHDQPKATRRQIRETEGEGPNYELRQTYQTEAEARAACKAKLQETQRCSAGLSITIAGNPAIAAEARLALAGVSRKLDGDWIVTQARHILKGSAPGYETQIEAETPEQRKDDAKAKGKAKS